MNQSPSWMQRVSLGYQTIRPEERDGVFPEAPGRLIVMGDLHGDWHATLNAFRCAGLVERRGQVWRWSGSNAWVVQLGDQIDRLSRDEDDEEDEASELRIMTFLDRLDREARRAGGRVISLLGNHETLNTMGNFTYVSPKGIRFFGNAETREKAFRPGGPLAIYMAKNRYAVVKIGDNLFVHGALSPTMAKKYTIPEMNGIMRKYLMGERVSPTILYDLLDASHSIFWSRMYSGEQYRGQQTEQRLEEVLTLLGGQRMFVGHTPQEVINPAFDGRVWRCDVGMSKAFGKEGQRHRIQVLELSRVDHRLWIRIWRVTEQAFAEETHSALLAEEQPVG